MGNPYHEAVLLRESVEGLDIKPWGVYVDATFGGGSHSEEILKKLTTGKVIAFDKDPDAMNNAPKYENHQLIHADFRDIQSILSESKIAQVDGLLADLGVSSHQFDVPERGFSTRYDAALDMRMDRRTALTAGEVVNTYDEKRLRALFWNYGELKQGKSIARELVVARRSNQIRTTGDLMRALSRFAGKTKEHKFFAQVFQALRIEVNDELNALKALLNASAHILIKGGRLSIISYHSLEDRLVKNYMAKGNFEGDPDKDFYGNLKRHFKPVNRKPISPSAQEVAANRRARSARLRIAEKL